MKFISIFTLTFLGILAIIYSTVSYFIYDFQYTLTHDGKNPEIVFKEKVVYFYIGCVALVLALILKFIVINKPNEE